MRLISADSIAHYRQETTPEGDQCGSGQGEADTAARRQRHAGIIWRGYRGDRLASALLAPQRFHEVHARGAPCRHRACDDRGRREHERRAAQHERIGRLDAEQE